MERPELKIKPPRSISLNFSELWENRELLYFFAWRDIKVKYKQTYLGILWTILQPLLLMTVFYFVFYKNLNISVGISYPIYVFSGLILWGLFSSGITGSSEGLLQSSQIIRKIYFPRLIIPLSALSVAFVDFLIAFALFGIILIFFNQRVSLAALYCFPLAILITLFSSFGIGTLLSALNVKYRDFRYLLPFGMQFIFFTSQITYSIHSISNPWLKLLLYINPLNGALDIFNYPLYKEYYSSTGVLISIISMLLYVLIGLVYFKKMESFFADII